MATIKFGAIVTDMRGKLGGHVFQKGNQSRVMKSYASPRQTISTLKRTTQGYVNASLAAYNALSAMVKSQWELTASAYTFKNKFNDDIRYTGRQFFLYLYTNLQKAGQPLTANPSNFTTVMLPYTFLTATFDVPGQVFTAVGDNALASNRVLYTVYVSPKRVQSVNLSKFVFLGNASSTNSSFAGLYATFVQRYGVPTQSMGIYVAAQTVNTSGYSNAPIWLRANVI